MPRREKITCEITLRWPHSIDGLDKLAAFEAIKQAALSQSLTGAHLTLNIIRENPRELMQSIKTVVISTDREEKIS